MFVGHAALAFAVAASVATARGWSHRRALAIGVVTGTFAAIPDVDISYALVGLVTAHTTHALALADAFWRTGDVVHRTITHSLVVAVPVAVAAALWLRSRRTGSRRDGTAALGIVAALVAVAGLKSGFLGAVIMALFCVAALGIVEGAVRRTAFGPRTLLVAALFGIASHPFGDLFTGQPPAMLYPLGVTLFAHRIAFTPDPTLNLLAAFGIELTTIWFAIAVYGRLTGRSIRDALGLRAGLGVGYAGSVLLIPAPTFDLSYPFVFSVLAVGALGLIPLLDRSKWTREARASSAFTAVVTGFATITLAGVAYTAAYLAA